MRSRRPPPGSHRPTHAELATFLRTFLPEAQGATDVPYLFHTPRHPQYSAGTQNVSRVVFSVTPTKGVYSALGDPNTRPPPACFLHRPWSLRRREVRRGSIVIASHNAFDAALTVGWNTSLASRLNLQVDSALCIQGYKSNPNRKIGLVAKTASPISLSVLSERVKAQFAGVGDLFPARSLVSSESETVKVVAIMNAFHPEEIDRALTAARDATWIDDAEDGSQVLYLTGAARDYGLEAAANVNMPALCVGHRACEEWGIRFLAEQTRSMWPGLDVVEVLEEEEERAPKPNTAV